MMRSRVRLRNMARAGVSLLFIYLFICLSVGEVASQEAVKETDHISGLAHIGIVVRDIDKTVAGLTKAFALPPITIEDVKHRKTKVALVDIEGVQLELMQNYSEDAATAKTVRERGDFISHFCLKTKDIVADIAILKRRGVEFRDEKPRASDFTRKWIAYTKTGTIGDLAFELLQPYPEPPK